MASVCIVEHLTLLDRDGGVPAHHWNSYLQCLLHTYLCRVHSLYAWHCSRDLHALEQVSRPARSDTKNIPAWHEPGESVRVPNANHCEKGKKRKNRLYKNHLLPCQPEVQFQGCFGAAPIRCLLLPPVVRLTKHRPTNRSRGRYSEQREKQR